MCKVKLDVDQALLQGEDSNFPSNTTKTTHEACGKRTVPDMETNEPSPASETSPAAFVKTEEENSKISGRNYWR